MPSARRTVSLPPASLASAEELRWAAKDPGDTLDYTLDAQSFLTDEGGDSIETIVSITSMPADLTFAGAQNTGTALTWFIGGGTAAESAPAGEAPITVTDYKISITLSTAAGLIIRRDIWMQLRLLSPNTSFGQAVTVVQGNPGPSGAALSMASFQALDGADQLALVGAMLNALPASPDGVPIGAYYLNDGIPTQVGT